MIQLSSPLSPKIIIHIYIYSLSCSFKKSFQPSRHSWFFLLSIILETALPTSPYTHIPAEMTHNTLHTKHFNNWMIYRLSLSSLYKTILTQITRKNLSSVKSTLMLPNYFSSRKRLFNFKTFGTKTWIILII